MSMFSNTASMTRSQSASCSSSSVPPIRPHAGLDVLRREAALLGRVLVVASDHGKPAVEGLLLRLDDGDRDAGVEEVHRDAAAHGPGPDDADPLDRDRGCVVRHVGDLGDLALGEENVALGCRLCPRDKAAKELALALHAVREGEGDRRLDCLDAGLRRLEAAELACVRLAELGEDLRLGERRLDGLVHVSHAPLRLALSRDRDGRLA
jgi:hypothetical protein